MVIFSILLMVVVLFFRKGLMGGRELSLTGLSKMRKKKEINTTDVSGGEA